MMKNHLLILLLLLQPAFLMAQADSLYVNGPFLYNHSNEKVTLKGINYAVLDDWNFPGNMNNGNERLSEIEKTKANAVRMEWYNDYGQSARPAYSLANLDSLLTRSARFKMIPIVGLWDKTCDNDWTAFTSTITNWWTQPAVVALFNKHKRYSIVNMANEFGYYNYAGGTTAALNTYKNNYKTAIAALRTAGYKQPIMIDAPDCGTNADALIATGTELLNSDPLKNIIFSVHAYWISFTGNDSTTMANKVQQMVNSGLPFVFGEIANYQADATPCQYALNYTDLLETLQQKQLGWLAWAWTNDGCASRQMTANGLFANMGAYGLDITNNPVYGLAATAIRSDNTFNNLSVLAAAPLIIKVDCNSHGIQVKYNKESISRITIAQSIDGINWQSIAQQDIHTTAGTIFFTARPVTGTSYYKAIAQTAAGGITSVVAACSGTGNLTVYPNPVKEKLVIAGNSGYNRVVITNTAGQVVLATVISPAGPQQVDTRSLPAGVYSARFFNTTTGAGQIKKLVISK